MSQYDLSFFDRIRDGARSSAEIIIPVVLDLLKPNSVLDVGCGQGVWLQVCKYNGVEDFLGIDGDYVYASELHIPKEQFIAADLSQGFEVNRQYDLALSLEVGEHLPERSSSNFIESLVKHSTCVLFSAAIPFQGGKCHLNEKWPSYWARKFASHGYHPWDIFRPRFWNEINVEFWYKQNMILFVKGGCEQKYPVLNSVSKVEDFATLDIVHPRYYLNMVEALGKIENLEKESWKLKAELLSMDIEINIDEHSPFLLIDDGSLTLPGRTFHRLMEVNGVYQGPPDNADQIVSQIMKEQSQGAIYLVQAWSAHWWDEFYIGFKSYLEANAARILSNDRCSIFKFFGEHDD